MASSVLISTYSQGKTDVAIVDDSGLFKNVSLADAEDQTVYFHKVNEKYQDVSGKLGNKEHSVYQAIIHIPANFNISNPENPGISAVFASRPGMAKKQFINQRMTEMVNKLRMEILHVDEETQNEMQKKVEVQFSTLQSDQENKGYAEAAALVGTIMGFAIYISLFFYGTMIMKGVMEEKTNRIVEVLTSSVKPFQLLMGKIVGVGAVGLTQFLLWMILTGLVYFFSLPLLAATLGSSVSHLNQMNTADVDPDSFLAFIHNIRQLPLVQMGFLFPFFFVGGFLLYGSLFAAVGAAMGEDGDQQSLMVPITVPIIISIFIAINVINNPDSSLGFWGSLIPFTSPVVMSTMLPFKPAWWQIGLSMVLLATGFILTTWAAARIYRVGILMYGKKITLKQMGRWVFSRG
jgi:ABC-2 type transport system permease protein